MEKDKKVIVLFSGGLDSTYLVWDNLVSGNEVYPIYIEIKNNYNKSVLEKNRVESLYKEFYKDFGDLIKPPKYVTSIEVFDSSTTLHLLQVPIWIFSLVYSQIKDVDEIQIGYVMNDDAVSYITDIKKIYNSYKGIVDELIPIKFPLIKYKKEVLFKELPKEYYNLTVTCEEPRVIGNEKDEIIQYQACGHCPACQRIINTRLYNEFPESYKYVEIDKSIITLNNLGKIIEEKSKNNKKYITFELPYDEPKMNLKSEPYQLKFNFDNNDTGKLTNKLEEISNNLKSQ